MSDDSAPTRAAPQPSTRDLGEGAVLAKRYQLLGLLGSGGMGTVYRARDLELGEVVALKVLSRALVDEPEALERFRREVRLARRVTHRGVARCFDIGEHEGEKFLTMELVEGESLATHLTRANLLTPPRAVAIARDICDALSAAHAAGVVHRDLKPANVIMATDGRVVLTDFGIARALDGGPGRTTGAAPVGTPAYMAPEQVEARPDIDARADVYALGVVLFEMLTGRPPFDGGSIYQIAAARLSSAPPDPSQRNPSVSPGLSAIVLRCLARMPDDRYSSASAVSASLAALSAEAGMTLRSGEQLAGAPSLPSTPGSLIGGTPRPAAARTTQDGTKTLAVLPFHNAGEPADQYLADGLTEDLIDQLSMTPGLRVRPRGAVLKYAAADRDVQRAGLDLGVDVVVEGTVRRTATGLRVTSRLLTTHDGFQLWARRLQLDTLDVLAVSDEVGRAVISALSLSADEPRSRRAPTSPVALDLFLRARHEYQRLDATSALRAVDLYGQALELAPDDPAILVGNALACVRHWYFGGVGTADLARVAAERAVAAAPSRGEARLALAAVRFQEGRAADAVREVRRALRLSPALADAHELLGRILAETGPARLAEAHLTSAARLDPLLYHARWTSARLAALAGFWSEAEAIVDATIEENAMSGGWLYAARLAFWRGDAEHAAALLARPALSAPGNDVARRIVAHVAGVESLDVDRLFDASLGSTHASGRSYVFLHQARGEFLIGTGRLDEGLASLERAAAGGLLDLVWLDHCHVLDPVRKDARFAAIRDAVAARSDEVARVLDESLS